MKKLQQLPAALPRMVAAAVGQWARTAITLLTLFYVIDMSAAVNIPRPSDVNVTLTPGDGTVATVSWTENGTATYWEIRLWVDNVSTVIPAPTNPCELTGLTADKSYYVRVRACADDENKSDWTNQVEFETTSKWFAGSGFSTTEYLPVKTYNYYSYSQQIYTAEELGEACNITSIDIFMDYTNISRTLDIYMVSTDKSSFSGTNDWVHVTADDLVFSGEQTIDGGDCWTTFNLSTPYTHDGKSNMVLVVYDRSDYVPGTAKFRCFNTTTNQALYTYGELEDPNPTWAGTLFSVKNQIRMEKAPAPAVITPRGVAVSYTGGTTATVAWNSPETVFDIDVNGTVTQNVTNPYTLSGLEYATNYAVKVRAKKGSDVSEWSKVATFTTDLSDDLCQITLHLTDRNGDGWNGAAIKVVDELSGIVIGTYTNTRDADEGEAQIYTAVVPNDRNIKFEWVSGSYDSECSYAVYDVNGDEIFSGSRKMTSPFTYHVNCTLSPWQQPTGLAASEVGATSAKLSWTENGQATKWVVAYKTAADDDFLQIAANRNPFTLKNLAPETEYTVKVRPATDEKIKWSELITFTTEEMFLRPANVTVNSVTTNAATIKWTGNADSYDLRYKVENTATIALYAEDVWEDRTGYQMLLDADAKAYGTVIPEEGPLLAPEAYAAFEYTIPEDADAALNTTHILIDDDAFIHVPPGIYDWCIVCPSPGHGIIIASDNGNVAGRGNNFEFEAGKVYDFFVYCGEDEAGDDTDAVDLDIYDFVEVPMLVSDEGWTTIENITAKSYELTGLSQDCQYSVEVRANYGDADHSYWTENVAFATPERYPKPTNVAASNVKNNSAVISWTAASGQTKWDIAYKTADAEDFTQKTITANPFTLTGLLPETDYLVKVRGNHGSGKVSNWSSIVAFTTFADCTVPFDLAASRVSKETATLKWYGINDSYNLRWYDAYVFKEDFEKGIGQWTTEHLVNGGGVFSYDSYSADGENCFAFCFTEEPPQYLISPELNGITGSATLSFYYECYDSSWPESFKVGYSTTTNDLGAFTWSNEITASNEEWKCYEQLLPGAVKYIAIQCTSDDQYYLFIDDVEIRTAEVPEEKWNVVENVTSPYSLVGLTADTEYEWQVQGVSATCGGTTDWSPSAMFTTTSFMLGDVNGDGSVTPADAIMVLYYYFGVEQNGFIKEAADVNGDKSVTPADAIEVLYIYFGSSGGARATRPIPLDMRNPE